MQKIIKNNIIEYLKLRELGYKTVWTGNGLICMKKEGLTLEEANEYCKDEDTRGEGFFDGFREE